MDKGGDVDFSAISRAQVAENLVNDKNNPNWASLRQFLHKITQLCPSYLSIRDVRMRLVKLLKTSTLQKIAKLSLHHRRI